MINIRCINVEKQPYGSQYILYKFVLTMEMKTQPLKG